MMILKTSRSNLSSNDQLSLDLPFAATKSIAARVGPTPTFTRGSGATYIGSDGLIHGVDTSTTSNTIGTGSRTFTLAATAGQDQFWRAGDAVEASNGANFMVGTVTSYDAATQSLVCNMTSIGGSGTFTSWRIGYRGPRFDHTSAGVCRGLLIEESRTNFIPFSEEFNDTSWGKASAGIAAPVVTANQGTAPDGQNTADRIVFAASTIASQEGHVWKVASGGTKAGGSSVTASVWLRTETGTATVYLSITEGATGGTFTACSVTTTWTRFTVTRTLTGTALVFMEIGPDTRTLGANQPTASGATALVWGAQLEEGSFPTSYIPTTTSSLARSADVCNITGGGFTSFYNQSEGTFLSNWSDFSPVNINNWPIPITTNSNFIARSNGYSSYNSSSPGAVAMSNGAVTLEAHYSRIRNILIKQASAYSGSGMAISANGLAVRTDPALFATNQTFLKLHGYDSGSQFNGHFAAIRYYKKRLSNAKLQSLTA